MDDNMRRIYEKYGINPEERDLENRNIFNKRMEELNDLNRELLVKEFNNGLDKNFDNLQITCHFMELQYF